MNLNPLNKNELEVMCILWEYGELKPAQVQEQYPEPIKNATLRSILRALVEKGHVVRKKKGKAYFYKAKTTHRNHLLRTFKFMARIFTGGSTTHLIAQLIKNETLSSKEKEELKKILEDTINNSSEAK